MKVLFLFGGLPHYYNPILNKLNNIDNLEIIVVVPKDKGRTLGKGVMESDKDIGFKTYYAEEYQTFYRKPFLKGLRKIFFLEKPDIIVASWPFVLGFVFYLPLFLYIKIKGIKLICKEIPFMVPKYKESLKFYKKNDIYNDYLNNSKAKGVVGFLKIKILTLIRKIYYNLCNAHVNYIEEAYEIIGSYGVSKEKIFITYNSPDTENIFSVKGKIIKDELLFGPNKYRLLHVGRLVPWKKVDLLIKVFFRIKQKYKDSELLIIGDGPEGEALKLLADKLGIGGSLKFIGGVYDTELLGKYFLSSSVYVLAGMGGLSINEAMCFGKPVICSVCDGTEKKLVRNGYNGYIFEQGSEDSLYEKINILFSNPRLIDTMGKNSENIIITEINVHTVIKGYVRAFNYVTDNRFNVIYRR